MLGYVLWPGTPLKPNKLLLNDRDIEIATQRLRRAGHLDNQGLLDNPDLNWTLIKKIFRNWKIWTLTLWDVTFWATGLHVSGGTYLLWINSLKRYNVQKVNNLGSTAPAIGIFYLFLFCFASDMFLGRAWALSLSYGWNLIGVLILVIWNVPESAKWFAYNTTYAATVISPVFHGWANDILKHNAAERAFVLVFMNCIAQANSAWIALVIFPTVEAPRFVKGFSVTFALSFLFLGMTQVVRVLHQREERNESGTASLADVEEKASEGQVINQKDTTRTTLVTV